MKEKSEIEFNFFVVGILLILGTSALVAFSNFFTGHLNLKAITAGQTGALLAQMTFYAIIVERITEVLLNLKYAGRRKNEGVKIAVETGALKVAQAELAEARRSTSSAAPLIDTLSQQVSERFNDLQSARKTNGTEEELMKIKADSQKFALLVSVFFGLLLGLVGVRIFGSLTVVDTNFIPDESQIRQVIKGIPNLKGSQDTVSRDMILALSEIKDQKDGTIGMDNIQKKMFQGLDVIVTGLLLAGGASGLHPILNWGKRLNGSSEFT